MEFYETDLRVEVHEEGHQGCLQLNPFPRGVGTAYMSPEGILVLASGTDVCWVDSTGQLMGSARVPGMEPLGFGRVCASRCLHRIFYTDGYRVAAISPTGSEPSRLFAADGYSPIWQLAASPAGHLAALTADGALHLWDRGPEMAYLGSRPRVCDGMVCGMKWGAGSDWLELVGAGSQGAFVLRWQAATVSGPSVELLAGPFQKRGDPIEAAGKPAAAWSDDGGLLVVGVGRRVYQRSQGEDGWDLLFEAEAGQVPSRLPLRPCYFSEKSVLLSDGETVLWVRLSGAVWGALPLLLAEGERIAWMGAARGAAALLVLPRGSRESGGRALLWPVGVFNSEMSRGKRLYGG